ncbi:MAG: condensation domain-containing protein, partial [Stellaceae bacterium]
PPACRLGQLGERLLLGLARVGRHDNFFALGGDSILSIQLVARARAAGLELTPRQIFQQQTLAKLAETAGRRLAIADQPTSYGAPVPLTPIQHWFFAQPGPLRHFNQAILLQVPPRLETARLERALAALAAHHDALRIRVFRADGRWQQLIAPPDEAGRGPWLVHLDLSAASAAVRAARLEEAAARLQASLDPVHGPMWRAMWFDHGESPGRLLLAIHHLAIDAVSWRILIEDLVAAYEQAGSGPPRLPPRTTPFQSWAQLLAREAHAPATLADLAYWRSVCAGACELPRDHAAAAANRIADSEHLTLALDAGTTQRLLREAPRAYRAEINDMLLTALALAVARWQEARYGMPAREFVIDLEGHGREDIADGVDLSRSVGWFTTVFPVRVDLGKLDAAGALAGAADAGVALKRVKEMLRAVPRKGLGFGLLSQLNAETASALADFPARQLLFNYLGQFDQMSRGEWKLAEESPGAMAAGARRRTHLIEANALVKSGKLCVDWSWCRDIHDRASIAALAELFLAALRGLVAHCLTPGIGGHTPSDFPLLRLRQEDLERLERDYPDLETAYPLSPLQQGLLFHAAYDSSADPYRVQLCLDIEGALDQPSMREAWQRLLDRHESLRVAVIEQDGLPLQIVRHGLALPWREEDWSAPGEAAFQRRLAGFLDQDRAQGFDFASGPLLRVALLRRSASRWVMVLTNHHLVLDGWSLSVLLNELITLYSQHQEDGPDVLPAPRAYRDYLTWLARQDTDAARAYWRERLAGAAPLPEVLDRPLGKPQGMAERRLTLSEEMVAELRGFVRRHGLTLGTLIHAAWAVVLAQYTGQKDVVFGTTVAGRPGELAGIERMVGLFINTLPLRVSVETDAVVVDWLKQLHALQLDDQRHGHASLAEIQRAADGAGGSDLFQTLVVVENYPLAAALVDGNGADRAGFRLTAASALERTHYPLTLIVLPRHSLEFRLSFDRARVEEAGVARLIGHLERVLRFLAQTPEGKLSELSLLSPDERRTITAGWNATAVEVSEASLPALFSAQAARAPAAVAVVCGGEHLSYGDLESSSNQLARRLIGFGIGPETVVGLALERSVELVVAVLAVLKAGGCYLPLDAGHPPARL